MSQQEQDRASLMGQGGIRRRVPGGWRAALIAVLAGALFGYGVRPGAVTGARAATGNRIAEVAPADIAGALDTVAGPPELLARYRAPEGCERRLAWVTVVRAPGQPPGRIRLRSGGYVSPAFDLGETPVRVALPFPAPYPAGRGMIGVVGTTVDAVVALVPPWHVTAQSGAHAIEVTWTPSASCPAGPRHDNAQ